MSCCPAIARLYLFKLLISESHWKNFNQTKSNIVKGGKNITLKIGLRSLKFVTKKPTTPVMPIYNEQSNI